jgi:hypothetical protein
MNPDQRFDILKTELSLIQATLDKYDDLIFRGRNFFVTLWLACLGLAFTIRSDVVPLLAVALSLLYWFLEGMMRHQYWFKYVDRYRFLRNHINTPPSDVSTISVYDLTNHFHRIPRSWWSKVRECFFKVEPTVLYGVMGLAALVLWCLLLNGVLSFPERS